MMSQASSLATRYGELSDRVDRALRLRRIGLGPVTLIAVSKTQPVEAIEELYRLGQRDFGENYAQELITKASTLVERGCREIRWHFIGHLQSNKAKALVPWVTAVHSVDSEKLARELAKRWRETGRKDRLPVFLEVNLDHETSKSGVTPVEAPTLAASVASLAELELQGLMCIPAPGSREPFRRLRDLEAGCRPHTRGKLSMGMTQDFEEAIREGATHIRIGTALFGPRAR